MGQTAIYACDDDMLAIFDMVESRMPLAYVRMAQHTSPRLEMFERGRDLPGIGREPNDVSVRTNSWLVTQHGLAIVPRTIKLTNGRISYAVDQLANEDTIEITPGGRLNDAIVLSGRIASVSDTVCAKQLMNAFRNALRRSFERVRGYWVGPAAAHLLDNGGRLTIATQSPSEFNLVRA